MQVVYSSSFIVRFPYIQNKRIYPKDKSLNMRLVVL